LKNGVENMLQHYIPEVTGVNAREDDSPVQVLQTKKQDIYKDRLAAAGIPFSE
jgi:Fe-S cluster biogenesis protein NfuA